MNRFGRLMLSAMLLLAVAMIIGVSPLDRLICLGLFFIEALLFILWGGDDVVL